MPSWYPGRPYKPVDMEEVDKGEIPKSKELKSKLDEWLTGNVVEPLAKAGYPNVGAGIATVPSSIAEFLTPESPYELAPGMAGVGKMTRKVPRLVKDIEGLTPGQAGKMLKTVTDEIIAHEKAYPNIANAIADGLEGESVDVWHQLMDRYGALKQMASDVLRKRIVNLVKAKGRMIKKEAKTLNSNTPYYSDNKIGGNLTNEINVERSNNFVKGMSDDIERSHETIFGKPTKPYLRPKGYANQKKQLKPTDPATKQMSREEYDRMLQGKTDPNYYDRLREEFYNREEELSPLERFLKGKGDQ